MLTAAARGRLVTLALLAPAVLFLSVLFLVPLGLLAKLSLSAPAGPFSTYWEILGSWLYLRVFPGTFVLAGAVAARPPVAALPPPLSSTPPHRPALPTAPSTA